MLWSIWHFNNSLYIIQRWLNFTAKTAHDGKYTKNDQVSYLLNKLDWWNINERPVLYEAIRVYEIHNKVSYPNGMVFSHRWAAHNRATQNADIDTEFRRIRSGVNAFSVPGQNIFYKLPAYVRNYTNATSFMKKCTILLLARR